MPIMDDSVRRLMRHIALGAPLALGLTLAGCDQGPGPGPGCNSYEQTLPLPGASDAGARDGGAADAGPGEEPTCSELCSGGIGLQGCDIGVTEVTCYYEECFAVGRRPDAPLHAQAVSSGDETVAWLVRTAVAEAGSVPAFERLAQTLERHGAPRDLVDRAQRSAVDEARHAEQIHGLAAHRGTPIQIAVHVDDEPLPSLFELARLNAEEGCVREAYAAIENAWQAEHAEHPHARAIFSAIARDEACHALLSLDIDRWAREQLGVDQVEAIERAKREAHAQLLTDLDERDALPELGVPGPARAVELAAALA